MKQTLNFCVLFSGLIWCLVFTSATIYEAIHLTTDEIIQKYGYPVEVHQTETEDGYIIQFHRIPNKLSSRRREIPILILHGLIRDSSGFVLLEEQSLAFRLSKAGYDVWLGNFRGNRYSKRHRHLQASNRTFWDYTFHEHGVYDLPALIDHICNQTGQKEILVKAISLGCTSIFVMASERPEYQNKIRGAVLFAPLAFLGHAKANFRFVFLLPRLLEVVEKLHQGAARMIRRPRYEESINLLCSTPVTEKICKHLFYTYAAAHEEFDISLMPTVFKMYVSTFAPKLITHLGQLIVSGKFQKFDYRQTKNIWIYNQSEPPEYNLKSVNIPLSLFAAPNDIYITKENLKLLLEQVPSVKSVYVIPDRTFKHSDFKDTRLYERLIFEKLLEQLEYLTHHGRNAKTLTDFNEVYRLMELYS